MSEHTEQSPPASWHAKLAAPAPAVLAVVCCLAAPLIIGAIGAVGLGALFGVGAGVVALAALCLIVLGRATASRR
jgi:hypothetical protein